MVYKTVNILVEVIQLFSFNKWIKMGIIKEQNVYGQEIKISYSIIVSTFVLIKFIEFNFYIFFLAL